MLNYFYKGISGRARAISFILVSQLFDKKSKKFNTGVLNSIKQQSNKSKQNRRRCLKKREPPRPVPFRSQISPMFSKYAVWSLLCIQVDVQAHILHKHRAENMTQISGSQPF